jgi:hypothetical protein
MKWEELQPLVEDSFTAREKDSDQHAKDEQQGEGDKDAYNNKRKGQRCISIIVHKVVQLLRVAHVDLVLTKFVGLVIWG